MRPQPEAGQGAACETGTSSDFRVLVTAAEAWPAFEQAVLAARREVSMGFRLFDLTTPLRSAAAREIGRDWFDLLAHKLAQGVRVRLVVSDFDPVMGPGLHGMTLDTLRQGAALAEVVGSDAASGLDLRRALHPARAGAMWRAVLGPVARHEAGRVPPFATVTHHQKLAVMDRTWLYIGGLDLNPRRYDSPDHDRPAEETWVDVQVLLKGPEAEDAARHLDGFLAQSAGAPPPQDLGHVRRTLSSPRAVQTFNLSPRTVLREIEADHLRAIRDAEHLIHIETQFLRSAPIARALARAGMEKPSLRLILVLPALPDDVAFDGNRGFDARYGLWLSHKSLKRVREAFGPRAAILSPVLPRRAREDSLRSLAGSPIIYVHSKTLLVDDRFGMVGSANLNGRSLRWDTEAALALDAPDRVAALRQALTAHWWGADAPPEAFDPRAAQEWWAREARRNAQVAPADRRGFLVPHDIAQVPDLHAPAPGMTEDIV